MSSSSFSPSSGSTAFSTPAPTAGTGSGAPATATLLFGFLVIFAALFAAFLFLVFFWKIQQRRRRTALGPEMDEIGGVPKLWEVWIRDEASENQSNWESASVSCVRFPPSLYPTPVGWCCPLCDHVANVWMMIGKLAVGPRFRPCAV
jgi:hypothetical protein